MDVSTAHHEEARADAEAGGRGDVNSQSLLLREKVQSEHKWDGKNSFLKQQLEKYGQSSIKE